jgi:transcriptional regulator with XRE-family HTH domain
MEHEQTGPHALAAWLRDILTDRGYDLSARGGGRTRFAAESGLGRATVSRILSGHGATDIRVLRQLADALGVPLGDILIKAALITPSELGATQNPPPTSRFTPEQAADGLGFNDPTKRAVFIASVHALQRPPHTAEKPGD